MMKKRFLLRRGNALVELVFVVFLWGVMFVVLIGFSKTVLIRQRALVGARLGVVLSSSGLVQEQDVEQELYHYFTDIIEDPSVEWTWVSGRYLETPASHFYRLFETHVKAVCSFYGGGLIQLPAVTISEKIVIQEASGV